MRLAIHLIITLIAFFTGVTVKSILTESRVPAPVILPREAPPRAPKEVETSAPAITASPAFILSYDPREFNPRGTYYLYGRKPADLREFDCFEVVVEERNGSASGDAMLYTKYFGANMEYHFTTGNGNYTLTGLLTKKQLSFVAAPKSGEDFEFRFDGRFLKGGRVSDSGRNEPVIRGKLTKLKDGVRVAEREVKFRVEYLGC